MEPHRWAGTKHQSLVHLQVGEDTEAAQDAKIIRAFRFASVKWWQNNLSPEVVRADAEGMALSIVEDDRLVKGLQDLAAKSCSEEGFRDCLAQGLKCETDRWEGHVIWLGPKAVEYFWGPTAGPPRYLRRVTCASSQSRAATVIDIAEEERAAARGWAKMHAFLLVHLLSLKRSDITKGMLLKLKCNDAPHVNKEGMMESFQAN